MQRLQEDLGREREEFTDQKKALLMKLVMAKKYQYVM